MPRARGICLFTSNLRPGCRIMGAGTNLCFLPCDVVAQACDEPEHLLFHSHAHTRGCLHHETTQAASSASDMAIIIHNSGRNRSLVPGHLFVQPLRTCCVGVRRWVHAHVKGRARLVEQVGRLAHILMHVGDQGRRGHLQCRPRRSK